MLHPREIDFFYEKVKSSTKGYYERVKIPSKKKTVYKDKTVTEPVLKSKSVKKRKPVYGISVAALFLIIAIISFVYNAIIISAGAMLLFVGGAVFAYLYKETVEERYTAHEEKTISVPHEVEEPERYEEVYHPTKRKITKIGRLSLHFKADEIQGNRLVFDSQDLLKAKDFRYLVVKDVRALLEADNEILKNTKYIPYVLEGDVSLKDLELEDDESFKIQLRGFENELYEYYDQVTETFTNYSYKNTPFRVITNEDVIGYLKPLQRQKGYFSNETHHFLQSDEGIPLDAFAANWSSSWEDFEELLNTIRIESVNNQLTPEFYRLGTLSHYSGFNFYCPECNQSIKESLLSKDYSVHNDDSSEPAYFSKNTKCQYDILNDTWKCPVCEKKFKTPIPVHKTLDEIMYPVYDKLMEENKVEREKAHSEIRKKEIENQNEMKKETQKIYFDNLSKIFELQDEMDRMKAELEGESDAITQIRQLSNQYRKLQSEIINDIEKDNEEIKREIKQREKKVLAEIDSYKENQLAKYEQSMQILSKAKRVEDEKRHKQMIGTLNKIDDHIQENTEATRETTAAVKETTEAVNRTTEAVNKNTDAVKEGTKATKEGFEKTNSQLQSINATESARAENEGLELHKHGFLDKGKDFKHGFNKFVGKIGGKSDHEIEKERFN